VYSTRLRRGLRRGKVLPDGPPRETARGYARPTGPAESNLKMGAFCVDMTLNCE